MTLDAFLEHVAQRKPLDMYTPGVFQFLNEMNDEARRITAELNNAYHSMDEIRELFSQLSGKPVNPTLRIFPPLYTDFGKNIQVGKMYSSMVDATSKTKAVLHWATIA